MTLIYILVALMLFAAVVVTRKNAQYILAGYNTLSDEKKREFDLIFFLKFFKRFLFFLAFSYLVIGLILYNIVRNENGSIIFSVMYPLVGFLVLILKSLKFYDNTRRSKVAVFIIGTGVIVAIALSIVIGMNKPEIRVEVEQLYISGPYGGKISYQDIVRIERIPMPSQSKKIEGFQLGNVQKGRFELFSNEVVTIISTTSNTDCLMITTHQGKYIIEYDSMVEHQIIDKLKENKNSDF